MFEISMEKDPALSLLYALSAGGIALLCISHYYFGHFDVLLINIIAIAIFTFAALFLYLNRDQEHSNYINVLTLTAIALLMQYQLSFSPKLTMYWIYTFPVLSYFVLPLSWAFALNTALMFSSFSQLMFIFDLHESLRMILIYILIGMCSLCYAYLNNLKQKNLLTLAVTDYQSGAYNSRQLIKKLKEESARSLVTKRTLSLFAVTIADYQQILDIHGQDISEKVLKAFRLKLISLLRAGDEIFHSGQGTFYILLPNCPEEGVLVLKERLISQLMNLQWRDVGEIQINTGLATLKENELPEDFFQRVNHFISKQQKTALRLLSFDQ
jgi:diguanylate cyclase (GGDEF)-like protein